jgi:glycosyltransferase involved in cell wall biosynthesis
LKILHITPAYKPAVIYGGPTMSVALLCEELAKTGSAISVFTTTANGKQELPVSTAHPVDVDGIPVTYFKRITKDHTHFSPALLRALWKHAKEFDVIHIHAWWNLVSVLSCGIALACKIPVVVSPRGMLSAYTFGNKNMNAKGLIHKLVGKHLLEKSHIHATSKHEGQAIMQLIQPASIAVIPNFVKLNPVTATDDHINNNTFKLLFFSRIDEKKGLDILINALKLVTIPYHLTIAGTGAESYLNYLKTLAGGLEDKITWAGFYGDDKFDLLKKHDLFVLPSHDENFGNVVIESLSVGTAVLISDQVGLASYVNENNLGWICERNTTSVSSAINTIGKNHGPELKKIRQNAPATVQNDFTGNALAQKYTAFYKKIVSA